MSGKVKEGTALVGFARPEESSSPSEDEDTARLVTRFQGGEETAFTSLYSRYFDRIYGYLRIVLRDHHEAEDLAQQVFMKAYESLRSYEMRRPFRAWLFTVARNAAISSFRKHGRVSATDPAEMAELENGVNEEAERWALSWISDQDLAFLIERLPERQRQVLALRFLLDLSGRQVAEIMDASENEVRMLQHRAQKFLRKRLAALGRAPSPERRVSWTGRRRQAIVLRERRFTLLNAGRRH